MEPTHKAFLYDCSAVLNKNWFHLDVVDAETQSKHSDVLRELFKTYGQLHQIPKLLSKFYSSLNEALLTKSTKAHFSQGSVDPLLLQTFCECVYNLPTGQTLDVWTFFLDVSQSFIITEKNAEKEMDFQAADLVTSRLFCSFLLHMHLFEQNVLPIVEKKFNDLLKQTNKLLKQKSSVLLEENLEPNSRKISFLVLLHAAREVLLAYETLKRPNLSNIDNKNYKCCSFSLFPSHISEECNCVQICQTLIEDQDIEFKYWMTKLLIQSIRTSILSTDGKPRNIGSLKRASSLLISIFVESTEKLNENAADTNTRNYQFSILELFLENIPICVHFIGQKKLVILCSAMIDVLIERVQNENLSSDRIKIGTLFQTFLTKSFFQESVDMQTAFVTAICRFSCSLVCANKRSDTENEIETSKPHQIFSELGNTVSKWEKYASTTPKDNFNEKSQKLWSVLKKNMELLNEILEENYKGKQKLKLKETSFIMKVMANLPLEYLLPANQTRCLLCLSTFVALLRNCNSKKHKNINVNEEYSRIFKNMIAIFEGVRSVWLFDFVQPQTYLKTFVKLLERSDSVNAESEKQNYLLILDHLFDLCIRNPKSVLIAEKYFQELILSMDENFSSVEAFCCLLHHLVQLMKRAFLRPVQKEVCERLFIEACVAVSNYMEVSSQNTKYFPQIVNCYCEMISLEYSGKNELVRENIQTLLRVLPQVFDIALQFMTESSNKRKSTFTLHLICAIALKRKDLPKGFITKLWNLLQLHLCAKSKDIIGISKSDLNNEFQTKIEENKSLEFSDLEQRAMNSVVELASIHEFEHIFNEITRQLDDLTWDVEVLDYATFQIKLSMIKILNNSSLEGNKVFYVLTLTKSCLMHIHFLMSQANGKQHFHRIIKPALEFVAFVLQSSKVAIPKQNVSQCLHSCLTYEICIYANEPSVFIEGFHILWSVLNNLVVYHLPVVFSSSSAYMSCVTNLLRSIIQAGKQDLVSSYSMEIQNGLRFCGQKIERLFITIAKQEKSLSKVVPYIIADYLHIVQSVTVHPIVKDPILQGINYLVDMISEESRKMLAVNISHSCQEIFNNLMKNYSKTKFTGEI